LAGEGEAGLEKGDTDGIRKIQEVDDDIKGVRMIWKDDDTMSSLNNERQSTLTDDIKTKDDAMTR
jgi:hypothetical protein